MDRNIIACILLIALAALPVPARARESLSLVVTANLEGRASLGMEEEENDFLLKLGQSLIHEKGRGRAELYLDLGNAFYPGALSRFSFGSVMMDFFGFFDCAATLISSQDMRIGVNNLDFVKHNRKTRLLSANIVRRDTPVFLPYFIHGKGDARIAFVGLSSKKILVDIAEKNIFRFELADHAASLKKTAELAKNEGARHIVVLSGLSTKDNIGILKEFPGIDLVVAGGDNSGGMYGSGLNRIDLERGRSIVLLPDKNAYYTLQLDIGERISVAGFQRNDIAARRTADPRYRGFADRFALWKKEYAQEGVKVIGSAGKGEYAI
ncbi:MAG TPA: hypothetical protein PKY31_05190, partial [Spirochaetota bacterium]|nr:hypothetical protein [Spirochaetota bacterium]